MLLGFRDSLISELDSIVQTETEKVFSGEVLKNLVSETVKAWTKNTDASELSVLLSEKDCAELESGFKAELKAEYPDATSEYIADALRDLPLLAAGDTTVITVSANTTITADSGTFTIPIVVNGVTYNKVFTWSCSKGGQNGSNAQGLTINANSTVIRSNDGGMNYHPSQITLTSSCQNTTCATWQVSTDGGKSFTTLASYNGLQSITVTLNDFESRSKDTLVFKAISTNTNIFDTITLQKLIDVSDINVGSVNLLNNSNFDLNYPTNIANWSVMHGTVENGGSTPPHSTKETCSNRYKHQACSSMVRALDFTKRHRLQLV